jgi:IS30 family transposase
MANFQSMREIGIATGKMSSGESTTVILEQYEITVIDALINQVHKPPRELYQAVTWDRGKEMADILMCVFD